jgi:hypothetical protein
VLTPEHPIGSFLCGLYAPDEFTPLVWTSRGHRYVGVVLIPAEKEQQ